MFIVTKIHRNAYFNVDLSEDLLIFLSGNIPVLFYNYELRTFTYSSLAIPDPYAFTYLYHIFGFKFLTRHVYSWDLWLKLFEYPIYWSPLFDAAKIKLRGYFSHSTEFVYVSCILFFSFILFIFVLWLHYDFDFFLQSEFVLVRLFLVILLFLLRVFYKFRAISLSIDNEFIISYFLGKSFAAGLLLLNLVPIFFFYVIKLYINVFVIGLSIYKV